METTLARLAERAEGNPLYARALSVDICAGAESGDIGSPLAWLTGAEGLGGGLAAYYQHLLRTIAGDAHIVADVLGVLDFAVTQLDLEDIVGPLVRGHVEALLRMLQPVLVQVSAQGGFRVFHESFRRFISETLRAQGRLIANALSPIVEWLQAKDFFADGRTFRFLVPALARAGRDENVWTYIDTAFVREAIAYGHALDPILANLAVASNVAARTSDWPMLVRCLELRRAALTAFDHSQNDWENYVEGYIDIFGADALAERLLFDGRPTMGRSLGLFACALADRRGGVPPWRDYLQLPDEETDDYASPFDRAAVLEEGERLSLYALRGRLRLLDPRVVLIDLYRRVRKHGADTKPLLLRQLARTTAEVLGVREMANLAERLTGGKSAMLQPAVLCALLLGIADAANDEKQADIAYALATRAATDAPDAETFLLCIERGAPFLETIPYTIAPSNIPIGVGPDTSVFEAEPVRQWVAEVRLQARRSSGANAVLQRERNRVSGLGWYRSWLRFVIDTAITEVPHINNDMDAVTAFRGLERDTYPFAGQPRVCDIWAIRHVIEESIARGLALLQTRDDWSSVLPILSRVAQETQYTWQGEDGGAIPTATFVRLLLPHVRSEAGGDIVLQALQARVAAHEGTHYPILAEFAIGVARARVAATDLEGALAAWSNAAAYLAAYGWRKDATVYELLESFDILGRVAPRVALRSAADVQDVVDAIVIHTDGKGTKASLNRWLQSLLTLAPAAAGLLLAHANAAQNGAIGWLTADALRLIVSSFVGRADATLLEHLLLTIPLGEYTGRLNRDDIGRRFAPLCRLARNDPGAAGAAFRVAYAVLCDDVESGLELRTLARDLAGDSGMPGILSLREDEDYTPQSLEATMPSDTDAALPEPVQEPTPPLGKTTADIYRALRTVARRASYNSPRAEVWSGIVTALSTRLDEMLGQGRDQDVTQLLNFFARDAGVQMTQYAHPIEMVGDALLRRGHRRHAAMAYALAYTSTRSDWVDPFGGAKYRALINRATELDVDVVRAIYADQLVTTMTRQRWPLDLSADVLDRLGEWDDAPGVEAAWRETFTVISERTPGSRAPGRFPRLSEDVLQTDWSLDEVIVALLLARLSDPRVHYKLEALRGVAEAVGQRPEAVLRPMRWWLTVETPRTSLVLVLAVLVLTEAAPYNVSREISEDLQTLCESSSWLVRQRAHALLERIGLHVASRHVVESVQTPLPSPDLDPEWQWAARVGAWPALIRVKDAFAEPIEEAERRAYTMLPDARSRVERAKLMWGTHRDAFPPTRLILWETEKLFHALDDALPRLSMNGDDDRAADPALLEAALVPDLEINLGWAASRCPRPQWQRPSEIADGVVDNLTTVGEDDRPYAGWTRLAIIERESLSPVGSHGNARPDRDVTISAAVVAWPRNRRIPDNAYPFLPCGEIPDRHGPIVGVEREGDWLSRSYRVHPPLSLLATYRLEQSALSKQISWRDECDQIAMVLRTWRVLRGNPDAEPTLFRGWDLLARPDMVRILEALHGNLRELRTSHTKMVAPMPG